MCKVLKCERYSKWEKGYCADCSRGLEFAKAYNRLKDKEEEEQNADD